MKEGVGDFSIGSEVWPGVSKVIEESGELLQVLGKLIALHGKVEHWDGSYLNERLIEEISDVRAALDFLCQVNLSPQNAEQIEIRRKDKLRLFCQWHHGQGGSL